MILGGLIGGATGAIVGGVLEIACLTLKELFGPITEEYPNADKIKLKKMIGSAKRVDVGIYDEDYNKIDNIEVHADEIDSSIRYNTYLELYA